MTRRDRTQPGSLAEHAVTGVRYCGGCNPRYDRTALVGRLAERCPNVRFVRAESGREYDALLVVGGCCACCADISGLAGRRVVRLRRAGVNRVSLGMQSAHDDELEALHRAHTWQQTRQAVAAIREAKVKNLTLDLIYGLPGQDMARWQDSVEQAIALQPEHLSCYGLKVEEGTPLCGRVQRGEVLPTDDEQADMYLWGVERLEAAGYHQYEISNFAQTGFQSRHNLKYWLTRPYLGFGPGAHSDFGGRRFSFVRDLDAYIDGVLNGGPIIDEDDLIPKRERSGEYLMLRLRTTWGIEEWEYRREYFMNFDPIEQKLAEYEHRGWAARDGQRWRLTPQGFLVSNQLIGELLELQESATLETTLPRVRREREQEI